MRAIVCRVHIDAPAERIWATLVDVGRYGSWNPFTPDVHGEIRRDGRVMVRARLVAGRLTGMPHVIDAFVPARQLSWRQANVPAWLLHAVRHQILEPTGPASTDVANRFEASGLLGPVVRLLFGPAIRRGMESMGQALKKEVEAGTEAQTTEN